MDTQLTRSADRAAENYRICARCVMDTSDPLIEFDANQVCNHCRTFDLRRTWRMEKANDGIRNWNGLVESLKQRGRNRHYDCIAGISGGVDSTYVVYLAAKAGLRVLAVHLDNGWNSELATHNIEQAVKTLGVDLFTHVIDWNEFRDLQLAFLRASTPDSELPTDHAIFALMMRVANRENVKYVLTGMNYATESINVVDWTYSPSDWRYIKSVHRKFGKQRLKTFPHFSLGYLAYTMVARGVRFVAPLNYLPYDRNKAAAILQRELGWRDYGGKHHESIYTRFFQSYILPNKFGIDKRRAHYSDRIKMGTMTREQALAHLKEPHYDLSLMAQDRDFVAKKFGIDRRELDAIMGLPRLTFRDYPNNSFVLYRLKALQHWLRKKSILPK